MSELGLSHTQQLAEFVAGLRYADLPEPAVSRAHTALLDFVGCAAAGSATPTGTKLIGFLHNASGGGAGTAIGADLRLTPPDAALANGTFGHALDFDDVSFHMIGHPGVTIAPAVLALAEAYGASGRAVLTAYVAGYEIANRLGYAMNQGGHYEKGWHATGTLGTIGAAAGAASILGLDPTKTACALGTAASMASGLRQNFGTDTKPLHAGLAARNGVTAAMLAADGFLSDPAILEAPFGFLNVYAGIGGYQPERLVDNLGSSFEIVTPGFQTKLYPSCASTHTAIDGMLHLAVAHDIDPDAVTGIDVGVVHLTPKILIHVDPRTGLEAKFSMQYCTARCLVSRHIGVSDFTDEAVADPVIRGLMAKVNMYVDADLDATWTADRPRPVTVSVQLRDGRRHSEQVNLPTGLPEKPASLQQLAAKYHDLAVPVIGAERAERAERLLTDMRSLGNTRDLMSLLSATPSP